ncbi:hypothetical protein NQZ68_004794 [Dissostichus eleginoides]|nr:hypothetical protein NQZ68_004794 [Dissostichus eleginoides]
MNRLESSPLTLPSPCTPPPYCLWFTNSSPISPARCSRLRDSCDSHEQELLSASQYDRVTLSRRRGHSLRDTNFQHQLNRLLEMPGTISSIPQTLTTSVSYHSNAGGETQVSSFHMRVSQETVCGDWVPQCSQSVRLEGQGRYGGRSREVCVASLVSLACHSVV